VVSNTYFLGASSYNTN